MSDIAYHVLGAVFFGWMAHRDGGHGIWYWGAIVCVALELLAVLVSCIGLTVKW